MAPVAPTLPEDLHLHEPYQLPVPASSALTFKSLEVKSSLWPTVYTPSRKDEPEEWSRGKVSWAWEAMRKTVAAAKEAQSQGEVRVP
jgi:tRNA-specific adenosine deaminase 3